MAAAFGKSTFGFFLTRYSMSQQRTETDAETRTLARTETVVDETRRQIVEERRAEDGSSPRSLPAVGEREPR
jgi:hypothetical protein